jgi:hypothetical protein
MHTLIAMPLLISTQGVCVHANTVCVIACRAKCQLDWPDYQAKLGFWNQAKTSS